MARFQIEKGDRFSLSKESDLEKIRVDLNWKSGADLDASAFLTGDNGVIGDDADFVFYNSQRRANPETGVYEPFNKSVHGNKKAWMAITVPVSADNSVLGSADDLSGGDGEGVAGGIRDCFLCNNISWRQERADFRHRARTVNHYRQRSDRRGTVPLRPEREILERNGRGGCKTCRQ